MRVDFLAFLPEMSGRFRVCASRFNIGALMIRIGFWGLLYYTYNKEPPKIV